MGTRYSVFFVSAAISAACLIIRQQYQQLARQSTPCRAQEK
jgi:hypothetical protein